jgi:hypothetical protein
MVYGADDVFVEREGRIDWVRDRLFEREEPVMHLMGVVGGAAPRSGTRTRLGPKRQLVSR